MKELKDGAEPTTTKALAARLLTVCQVCAKYPGKGGGRMAPSTVTRWILSGCPDRNGTRVRLRATRVGSRWLVDPDDLTAFFAALAASPSGAPPPAAPTPEARAARACALLARRGA